MCSMSFDIDFGRGTVHNGPVEFGYVIKEKPTRNEQKPDTIREIFRLVESSLISEPLLLYCRFPFPLFFPGFGK